MITKISVADMESGEVGKVVELLGGAGMQNRLKSLGIRPGVKISKVNSAFNRGPVVLKVGRAQTVLGFGISYKVLVEVDR